MTMRVNLFIVGAMKSGTTSLHEYLNVHPNIVMSSQKEPGYFVKEIAWHLGEAWYNSLFQPEQDECYRGEASTHYAKFPLYKGVAERIADYNKAARILYIMRDPFARTTSHFWHEVRAKYDGGELRNFKTAIQRKPDYLDFSNYPLQLQQYYQCFPAQQIYVLTFEELVAHPTNTMRAIFEWLNLAVDIEQSVVGAAFNAKPQRITGTAGLGILNKIQYSETWAKLSPFIPQRLKNVATEAAYKTVDTDKLNAQIMQAKGDLAPLFKEQTSQLKALTGRDFPEWPDYN